MPDINNLMTLTVIIEVNGMEKGGDTERPHHESYQETFGVGDEDACDTVIMIRDIADAVEQGRIYGWMTQEAVNAQVSSGDLRALTGAETLDAIRAEHETGGT